NMSYLSDFQELNGGYVSFGVNPKGGKISGKGKIKAGTGPPWLFDIDSLTRTMNYQPVTAGNQSNSSAGFQEEFDTGKIGEEANQQYMLFPVWSTGSTNSQNKEGHATFDGKACDTEKPESAVNLSSSSSALSGEQDDMTKKKDKGKSPVDYFTRNRDFNAVFDDFSENSSNDVSAASPIVPTAGLNYSNNTNSISAAGPIVPVAGHNYSNSTNPISAADPSNSNLSPTHGQSSLRDTYLPPDMVEREDIVYSDHENVDAEADFNNLETSITVSPILTIRTHNAHPRSQIISNLSSTTQTRSMTRVIKDQGGISQILNEDFHTCMKSFQFKMQKVWILVDLPHEKRAIGTEWVYRNKKDERGIVVRNKARLVTQGHTQEEGIDYEEVFTPVARIEAIRLFLAYASFMGFMRTIEEEVYVCQPPGFEDPDHPDKVYKVVKALYGLHQAPRAWYETLDHYLLKNGFHRGQIDQTLFIKKQKGDNCLCRFMWMISYLVKQKEDGIFINQDKYVAKILKKFGLPEGKSASTPIDTEKPLLKDPDGKDVDAHTYRSMIGSLMYLTSSRPDIMFAVESLISQGDLSTHSTKYISPALTQKVFANMRRGAEEEQGNGNNAAEELVTAVDDVQSPPPQQQSPPPAQPQGAHFPMNLLQEALDACFALTRRVEHLEQDKMAQDLEIIKLKTRVKKLERSNKVKTVKLRRLRKIGTSQRIESSDDTHIDDIMQEDEPEIQEVVEVVTTAKLITEVVAAVSETVSAAAVVQADVPAAPVNTDAIMTTTAPVKVTDKGKCILVEESKPMRKKQQVKSDEAYARKIQEEFNQDIDWETAIDHVKQRAKEEPFIQRYQTKEQIEEEESRAIALINETSAQKAAKKRRLNKEAEDVKELKKHLEIVPDEDDNVFTEATPLARKVPIVDYQIIHVDNKPRYKIIQRFSTSKPNNFSDEYLLSTLKTMFGRPDGQDNVWKDQRSAHGQALVKSWKLLTSCRVYLISFTTTQIILLVERRYPLLKFTLEQMINVVRLQVEEQSDMSLELIRFTRQQLQEGQHN
nr:hypothetical protein [Tanacetum cinerariifolium]